MCALADTAAGFRSYMPPDWQWTQAYTARLSDSVKVSLASGILCADCVCLAGALLSQLHAARLAVDAGLHCSPVALRQSTFISRSISAAVPAEATRAGVYMVCLGLSSLQGLVCPSYRPPDWQWTQAYTARLFRHGVSRSAMQMFAESSQLLPAVEYRLVCSCSCPAGLAVYSVLLEALTVHTAFREVPLSALGQPVYSPAAEPAAQVLKRLSALTQSN